MRKTEPLPPAKEQKLKPWERSPHPPAAPELCARAEELERQLGRPLRLDIEGPLTDEESEEMMLARLMDGERMSIDELLAKHGRG